MTEFVIPYGGLSREVGPLCRVIRDDGDRIYVSIFRSRGIDRDYGIRSHGGKNHYVFPGDVLVRGEHVDELYDVLLELSDTVAEQFKKLKARHRAEEIDFFTQRKEFYDKILSGDEKTSCEP